MTLATLPRDLGRQLTVLLTFEKRCKGPMHQSGWMFSASSLVGFVERGNAYTHPGASCVRACQLPGMANVPLIEIYLLYINFQSPTLFDLIFRLDFANDSLFYILIRSVKSEFLSNEENYIWWNSSLIVSLDSCNSWVIKDKIITCQYWKSRNVCTFSSCVLNKIGTDLQEEKVNLFIRVNQ